MELEIKGLQKAFTNRTRKDLLVLDGVDLKVASGEFVSIVGPSGCGKSTLLEIIAGLQHKTDGDITIDGLPIDRCQSNRAIVFQQYGLFPWLTVQKNIEYGLKVRGINRKTRNQVSREQIAMLGLSGFQRFYPHELSGGMQQRVALARALANRPDILLLDEPFAALDAQTREICQRELLNLWKQTGVTILFVTHDVSEAIFLSDKVLVMSKSPGAVKALFQIDLQRPRDSMIRLGAKFREMEYQVRILLSDENELNASDSLMNRPSSLNRVTNA
jgi:NitT/TauT family transport system ATP-binding protein